jgi:hypothetical protein
MASRPRISDALIDGQNIVATNSRAMALGSSCLVRDAAPRSAIEIDAQPPLSRSVLVYYH